MGRVGTTAVMLVACRLRLNSQCILAGRGKLTRKPGVTFNAVVVHRSCQRRRYISPVMLRIKYMLETWDWRTLPNTLGDNVLFFF